MSWSCSCGAGAALCHHSLATVFPEIGLKAVSPILSKTSMPQVSNIMRMHRVNDCRYCNETVEMKIGLVIFSAT